MQECQELTCVRMEMEDSNSKTKSKKGVDRLYEIYECLNTIKDKKSGEPLFMELLVRLSSSENEKKLACQFIARFVEYYPGLEMEAINVLFDVCEDSDASLRKQALRDLVTVCKKRPNLASSISYVFVQMLQTEEATELAVAQDGLKSLIAINADLALVGIFAQIRGGDYAMIDCCLKFLQNHMKTYGVDVRTLNVQTRLFKEVGKSIACFDNMEHFKMVMEILGSTAYMKTIEGNKRIVEMVEKLVGVGKSGPSSTMTSEIIAKLLVCSDFLFPFFHGRSNSASLFAHYCLHILPNMSVAEEATQFSLVRMAVDLSLYFDKLDDDRGKLCLESLLKVIDAALAELPSNPNDRSIPDYHFSFLEGVLYIAQKLVSMHPEAFKEMTEKESFANLKLKLRHMLRAVVTYKIKLRGDLRNLPREELKKQDVKVTCLRTLTNVGLMSRDLWLKKEFKEQIRLSWKARTFSGCKETVAGYSRKIKGGEHDIATKLYRPPNGKYSGRAGSFVSAPESRGVRRTNIFDDNVNLTGNGGGLTRSRNMLRRGQNY